MVLLIDYEAAKEGTTDTDKGDSEANKRSPATQQGPLQQCHILLWGGGYSRAHRSVDGYCASGETVFSNSSISLGRSSLNVSHSTS